MKNMRITLITLFIVLTMVGISFGYSDNDFTNEEKTKLETIQPMAETNPPLVSQVAAEAGNSEIEYS